MRHVFIACDMNVLDPAMTTIYSLTVHTNPAEYTVTLVVTGTEAEVDRARHLVAEQFGSSPLTVNVLQALPTFAECRPTVLRITTPTFTRMEMDRYLPMDVHRVLYVDTDVIFTGDPCELFELPLNGLFAAVVHDRWTCREVPTFNAGVMMVNMDTWRAEHVTDRVLALNLTRQRITDQGIMNMIFSGRCLEVNGVFNFVPGPAWKITLEEFVRWYMHGRRDVRIMHFAGPDKPWLPESKVNCVYVYRMYQQRCVDLKRQHALLDLYTRWEQSDIVSGDAKCALR